MLDFVQAAEQGRRIMLIRRICSRSQLLYCRVEIFLNRLYLLSCRVEYFLEGKMILPWYHNKREVER